LELAGLRQHFLLLLLLLAVLLVLWLLWRSLPLLCDISSSSSSRWLFNDHLLDRHTHTPKGRRQEQLPSLWHLLLLLLLVLQICVSTTACCIISIDSGTDCRDLQFSY
jgi:hypothetical protein